MAVRPSGNFQQLFPCIFQRLYFVRTLMARKRSIGICDQTWSALLMAGGGASAVRSAFR